MKLYICKTCGNIVLMVKDSGVNPVCCGKPMEELTANTVDAALEKHVPAVTIDGKHVDVEVGSVPHPMTPEHHIAFVVLETDKGHYVHHLDVNLPAKTRFHLTKEEKPVAVYEYCNLHGLWKVDL